MICAALHEKEFSIPIPASFLYPTASYIKPSVANPALGLHSVAHLNEYSPTRIIHSGIATEKYYGRNVFYGTLLASIGSATAAYCQAASHGHFHDKEAVAMISSGLKKGAERGMKWSIVVAGIEGLIRRLIQ